MKKNEIDAVLKAQKLCDYAKYDNKLYYAEIEKIDGLTASIMCYRLFPFKVKILELYMMYRNFEDFDIELCIDQVRDSIQTVLKFKKIYGEKLVELANECKNL